MNSQFDMFLPNGEIIDSRHIEGIEGSYRYSPQELAKIMCCDQTIIYKLCARENQEKDGLSVDPRHSEDIERENRYTALTLSKKFNVNRNLICKLRYLGELESTPLLKAYRIPGWSIIDYVQSHASPMTQGELLDFVSIGKLIRIPGWSIIQYLQRNCSHK